MQPDEAVQRALRDFEPGSGRVILVAAGKAAWQMAYAAYKYAERIDSGIVITKYDHVKAEIEGIRCFEVGHPVPDENSFMATREAVRLVEISMDMDLKSFDDKCVRITTSVGEVYEGVALYCSKEYVFNEYGENTEVSCKTQ